MPESAFAASVLPTPGAPFEQERLAEREREIAGGRDAVVGE
jgi:hypothetical protein